MGLLCCMSLFDDLLKIKAEMCKDVLTIIRTYP